MNSGIRGFRSLVLDDCEEDEVVLGAYHSDDSPICEFSVLWIYEYGVRRIELRVEIGDAWGIFAFEDILELFATLDESITPEQFCKELVKIGLKDLTKR